jgi:hypothetical protein
VELNTPYFLRIVVCVYVRTLENGEAKDEVLAETSVQRIANADRRATDMSTFLRPCNSVTVVVEHKVLAGLQSRALASTS